LSLRDSPSAPSSRRMVIKQGPHRTVCRVETPAGEFYLKRFHQPDWRTRLRHWLRGRQANWEWSRHRRARQLGIPTAEVVAIGHSANWSGESGLVTGGLPGVVTLEEWLASRGTTLKLPVRRQLAARLAELVANMHRRGAIHRDLHAGNLLIRDDAGQLHLWLIDLSPLRFRSVPASWRSIGSNLGRLRHSLLPYLRETDQAAFFRTYWDVLCANGSDRRRTFRELADRCNRVAHFCGRQSDRKWARGNRKTFLRKTPDVHFRGLADLGHDQLTALCSSPESWLADAGQKSAGILLFQIGERLVRISVRRGPRPILSTAQYGWARHCWEVGHALWRRMIPAVMPLCMWECQQNGEPMEAFAVPHEPQWRPVESMISAGMNAELNDVGGRITDVLRRFHDHGFSHYQLQLDAFELHENGPRFAVRFARLEAIRQEPTTRRRRLRELAALAADVDSRTRVSRSNWLRWLLRYRGRNEATTWKTDWRIVVSMVFSSTHCRAA
jgi:tRNA A-37 threonylcarbamoyl transferase component Bud32